MSVVPDVPNGLRFNYDTYLPDCVALEPHIYMENVKPYFYYHNPPLAHMPPLEAQGRKGATQQVYQKVQPSAAVTQALQSLHTVQPPRATAAAEHTSTFRPQELEEGPALPDMGRGWWRMIGRGSVVCRMAAGLGVVREESEDIAEIGPTSHSPTFMPPAACAFASPDGGVAAVSATGRQVFVPGGVGSVPPANGPDAGAGVYVPSSHGPQNGAYRATPPTSLESK